SSGWSSTHRILFFDSSTGAYSSERALFGKLRLALNYLYQVKSINDRHDQVGNDQVRAVFLEFRDRPEPILDGLHPEAQVGQAKAIKGGKAVVVFDQVVVFD